ncbi:MAG: protein kinase [Myxococcota bacterium]
MPASIVGKARRESRGGATDEEGPFRSEDIPNPERRAALVDTRTVDPGETLDPVGQSGQVSKPGARTSGARIGNYQLERKLGAGGMGAVFAARHVETGQRVAVKILSSTTGTGLYRFKREFRVLADLSHRNLVHLFELVVPQGEPAFFAMELLDGQFFVDWVRGSTPVGRLPDLVRLRDGLRQLVEGVSHLHAHDCVHRDLKPSNVLVTGEGRVVVLDFGLVSELSEPDKRVTRDRQVLGTPVYMAPEQALGERVGPAADYYALGVILYECLTGRIPHEGAPLSLFIAKQEGAPDPGVEVAALPEDLRVLCVRLLTRDPQSRPVGREILECLQARDPSESGPAAFVGRREELSTLEAALREVGEREGAAVVHLRGRSGYGKSAVVRRFRAGLRAADAIVLHGRCREREIVPYKGVDAIVDVLSSYLRRLPASERTKLRPVDLAALIRVFPVFDDIWEPPHPQILGSREALQLGEVTLRKLLCAMSERLPVVVYVDDFQWADSDSVRLLEALVRPPQEPKMLVVLSYRSEAEGSDSLRDLVASKLLTKGARVIELGPLPDPDAYRLASSLLWTYEPSVRTSRAQTIALRSRGNPFFITQMALNSGRLDGDDTNPDHFVSRCLADLKSDARRLLELVAVSGAPLSEPLACDLAGVGETAVRSLCDAGLLVHASYAGEGERERGRDDRFEAAHDRIREVVLAGLDPDRRALLHRRIGQRLLAEAEGDPKGDAIFAVVDHLVAGIGGLGSLSTARRLELARLGGRAGRRALESGACVAARRYFGVAYDLLLPWRAEAEQGGGQYPLCVAIAFGRVQAQVMLDDPEGDEALYELLGWSLTTGDYGRITQWYSEASFSRARFREGVDFGLRSLTHLGLALPRSPSRVRSLFSFYRGWRLLWKSGLGRVYAMPRGADERTRACMELIALTSSSAAIDVSRLLCMMGSYCQMLVEHGLHDRGGLGLANLALLAVAIGEYRRARELIEFVERFLEDCGPSAPSYLGAQHIVLVASSALHPVEDIVAPAERLYARSHEVAPVAMVEIISSLCVYIFHLAGTPLHEVGRFLDGLRTESDRFRFAFMAEFVSVHRLHVDALTQGLVHLELARDPEATLDEVMRCWMLIMRGLTAFLLGDQRLAGESLRRVPRDYLRRLGPLWFSPVHAMLSVLVMAERWPEEPARGRRQMSRQIRRHRETVARWARGGPENFQPMLDVIDGEIAALEGDYGGAVAAYEGACARVSGRMPWLRGLVCERLGRLGQRRGHTIMARAAFDAAREAYEAWGATVVVRRLERTRAAAG